MKNKAINLLILLMVPIMMISSLLYLSKSLLSNLNQEIYIPEDLEYSSYEKYFESSTHPQNNDDYIKIFNDKYLDKDTFYATFLSNFIEHNMKYPISKKLSIETKYVINNENNIYVNLNLLDENKKIMTKPYYFFIKNNFIL